MRVCRESAAALASVLAERPELSGDALYEAVVARRLQVEAAPARAIVWKAHQMLGHWGNNRDPKLVDVVKCMIISEYLGADAHADGMLMDLGAYISDRFDRNRTPIPVPTSASFRN
jgi:hypothetical protein